VKIATFLKQLPAEKAAAIRALGKLSRVPSAVVLAKMQAAGQECGMDCPFSGEGIREWRRLFCAWKPDRKYLNAAARQRRASAV
jgi:hypothetical protein